MRFVRFVFRLVAPPGGAENTAIYYRELTSQVADADASRERTKVPCGNAKDQAVEAESSFMNSLRDH
jgi:hypothetical protein